MAESHAVSHVDATIHLFAPDLEPKMIRARVIRQPDSWFEPGEVKRRVLDTLRRPGHHGRPVPL